MISQILHGFRRFWFITWTISLGLVGGCGMMGPSAKETRTVQQRIEALDQRVTSIEQRRLGAASPMADGGWSESSAVADTANTSSAATGMPMRDRMSGAFQKFFRGGVNLITGWVEIPKRIQETSQQSGAAAGWTWGLMRGFGYGFIRTVAGAYELVTFPAAAPSGFRPVIQPEFVF